MQAEIGAWVVARQIVQEVLPDGRQLVYATPGELGRVIDTRKGFLPTVWWQRSGMVTDCEPGEDFVVLLAEVSSKGVRV